MSRAYRIRIAESLTRHVRVDDGVQTRLDILPVLATERMSELLSEELARRGFEADPQAPHAMVLELEDGIQARVDLRDGQIVVRARSEHAIELEVDRVMASAIADETERERVTRAKVVEELEAQAAGRETALRRDAASRAAEALDAIRGRLDEVSVATTRRALEERAAQLGEIKSVEEDPDTGAITIRVRV